MMIGCKEAPDTSWLNERKRATASAIFLHLQVQMIVVHVHVVQIVNMVVDR